MAITRKGYRRIRVGARNVMEHVYVWEQAHGPVPPGHDVHHRDGDKAHNDLANLQLLTKTEHKRLHGGCEIRDGVWWKPCRLCGTFKPIDAGHWYLSPEGWPLYGRCRPCHIAKVVAAKRLRRLRRAACGAPPRREAHATVKPLALMRWLIRLVTPPGGVVLDPFLGSGATAEAAELEGVRWLGCERSDGEEGRPDYLPLIAQRLARVADGTSPGLPQPRASRPVVDPAQPSLFG